MLAGYPKTQGWEGPFMQEMLEAARVSMVRYHELPLWNPYQCGGVALWDNPQGMGAAPLFWPLVALSDTTRAMELWYMLHAAVGFASMWLFSRHELGLSRGATLVASGTWAFCGAHNQHLTGAGFQWAAIFFLPLAVLFWRRAERDPRMAVGVGILGAMGLWGGALYPLMVTGLVLAGETMTRAWQPSRLKGIAVGALIAGLVTFGLSAGRFIPVVYQAMAHKRDLGIETDALQWSTLVDMFVARSHSRGVAGQQYVWPEYGDYIGPFLISLSLIGIVIGGARNVWVGVVLAWAFLLMLGHAWSWAPWHLLKGHVYPFKDMRVPSRFNVPVTMFLGAFAGIAIDRTSGVVLRLVGSRSTANAARTIALAIGLIGMGDMISLGLPWVAESYQGTPLVKNVPVSPRLFLEGPGLADFVDQPQQNRGRFQCWEEWAFGDGAAVWTGDVPQARAASPTAKVGIAVTRTQNSFVADVDAKEPVRILFNTAYDRGWRATTGNVVNQSKLLAVDVPAGQYHLVVKYWPLGLTVGLVITVLSIAGTIAFFWVDASRRRRAGGRPPLAKKDTTTA